MNELTPLPENTALTGLSVDELLNKLKSGIERTVEIVREMAGVVRELESRGVDLEELKLFGINHLRRVAYGQSLPEVFVRFQGAPMLLQRISSLPIPDQKRLAEGGTVTVLHDVNGNVDHREMDPLQLSRDEIVRVFGPGEIRPLAQQRSALHEKQQRQRLSSKDEQGVIVNHKLGGIEVNGKFLSRAEILQYLARLEDKKR